MTLDWHQNLVSLNILRTNQQNVTKLIYAYILTRARLGLLPVIFDLFITELWPLIDVRIPFPLNIFRANGQILTKLCICIYIDKI